MKKEENEWSIVHWTQDEHKVCVNGSEYEVDAKTAAICHAILLLVDAVNDKPISSKKDAS